ncbi:MAG: TRAP transporter substrate-binding protein [Lachnospiraceae bacterium]|nr:TRAP transporter substrate-binding protein [Lachnospiraceae bacterium]
MFKKVFAAIVSACTISAMLAAPAAAAETLTLASTLSDTTSVISVSREMADQVREATDGEIDIQVFPDSTLGSQDDFLEGVQMGTVDMCIIAAGALEDYYDQYAVYSVPFLFNSTQAAYDFFMSEDGQAINDAFREQTGMRVIGLFNEGFRQVWSKAPIYELADFKGMKLRVPDVTLYINMFTELGSQATVVPYGDLYTGLQTGLVEGMELPIASVYGSSTYEQVKYCTLTNHIGGAMCLLVNEGKWEGLTEEQQNAILQYADEASEKDRANLKDMEDEEVVEIEESGVEFIELTQEARDEIVEAMGAVIDSLYGDKLDPAMLERAREFSK